MNWPVRARRAAALSVSRMEQEFGWRARFGQVLKFDPTDPASYPEAIPQANFSFMPFSGGRREALSNRVLLHSNHQNPQRAARPAITWKDRVQRFGNTSRATP